MHFFNFAQIERTFPILPLSMCQTISTALQHFELVQFATITLADMRKTGKDLTIKCTSV